MAGRPDVRTYEGKPGMPATTRDDTALKTHVAYGGMHLCRWADCEVWVADGGDHRCVLHSREFWAAQLRMQFVSGLLDVLAQVGLLTPSDHGIARAVLSAALAAQREPHEGGGDGAGE